MNHRILSLLAVPALTAAAPVTGDLALVAQHLSATRSMTAAFSQTDRQNNVMDGTLTLKQPGKVRFQYAKGIPQLIVSDGTTLYFIDYSVRQVSTFPVKSSPLSVLLDPARDIGRYARLMPSGDPRVISVQAYDRKRPEYGRLNLVFIRDPSAPAGLRMTGWVALDAQGNRTTVRLTQQRYNVPVSDEAFRWDDPRRKPAQKPARR